MKVETKPSSNKSSIDNIQNQNKSQNPQGLDFFNNLVSSNKTNAKEVENKTEKKEKENKIEEQKGKIETNKKIQQDEKTSVEELLKKVEEDLKVKAKVVSLTDFNNIAFNKKLIFRLLFVRERIYLKVWTQDRSKSTIIAIDPPRWGGTSLRYLISQCVTSECQIIERQTNKGKVLTYKSLTSNIDDSDSDIDIFD